MDALDWLRLQIEWGADEAVAEHPVDRRVSEAKPPPRVERKPPTPVVAKGSPVERARALAEAADTPDALHAALQQFDGCALSTTATNLVFRDGNPTSRLVLVADVPGPAEDRAGVPFAGANAELLGRMLGSIGLLPADLLATSLLPWRPPGDRKSEEAEVQCCLPFLLRHLRLVAPSHVLLFGALAGRALLPGEARRSRTGWQQLGVPGLTQPIPALAFASLSHIAVTAAAKREAWNNLLMLKTSLDGA
jgi:DNA polymerase